MKHWILIACLGLAACAASQKSLDEVARTESARLERPSRPLSSFADWRLAPMKLSPAVESDERKVAVAANLETRLQGQVQPLFAGWRADPVSGRAGTLVIEPQLAELHVVSGGARFWLGAMAGDSSIDLDLVLTEEGSSGSIARVRIARDASGYAGGWSVGKSDQNLLDYIAAIVRQYLLDSY